MKKINNEVSYWSASVENFTSLAEYETFLLLNFHEISDAKVCLSNIVTRSEELLNNVNGNWCKSY